MDVGRATHPKKPGPLKLENLSKAEYSADDGRVQAIINTFDFSSTRSKNLKNCIDDLYHQTRLDPDFTREVLASVISRWSIAYKKESYEFIEFMMNIKIYHREDFFYCLTAFAVCFKTLDFFPLGNKTRLKQLEAHEGISLENIIQFMRSDSNFEELLDESMLEDASEEHSDTDADLHEETEGARVIWPSCLRLLAKAISRDYDLYRKHGDVPYISLLDMVQYQLDTFSACLLGVFQGLRAQNKKLEAFCIAQSIAATYPGYPGLPQTYFCEVFECTPAEASAYFREILTIPYKMKAENAHQQFQEMLEKAKKAFATFKITSEKTKGLILHPGQDADLANQLNAQYVEAESNFKTYDLDTVFTNLPLEFNKAFEQHRLALEDPQYFASKEGKHNPFEKYLNDAQKLLSFLTEADERVRRLNKKLLRVIAAKREQLSKEHSSHLPASAAEPTPLGQYRKRYETLWNTFDALTDKINANKNKFNLLTEAHRKKINIVVNSNAADASIASYQSKLNDVLSKFTELQPDLDLIARHSDEINRLSNLFNTACQQLDEHTPSDQIKDYKKLDDLLAKMEFPEAFNSSNETLIKLYHELERLIPERLTEVFQKIAREPEGAFYSKSEQKTKAFIEEQERKKAEKASLLREEREKRRTREQTRSVGQPTGPAAATAARIANTAPTPLVAPPQAGRNVSASRPGLFHHPRSQPPSSLRVENLRHREETHRHAAAASAAAAALRPRSPSPGRRG